MAQITSGAFSSDKNGTGLTVTPMWDDPSVWTNDFLNKITAQPGLVHWYQNWHDSKKDWNRDRIFQLTERGEMPMISWAPRNPALTPSDTTYNHAAINAGTHDAYIDDWATKAAALGRPIIIRPMWEMNSTVYSWGVGVQSQTGTTYINAFRRLVDRFRAKGAYNVKWCWCPLANGSFPVTTMYPGDTYVDYLGLDGYNFQPSTVWNPVSTVFDSAYTNTMLASPNKPMIIAEVGCMEDSGDKGAWITDLYARTRTTYPKVKAIVWFDANLVSKGERDWRVNTTTGSMDAYEAALLAPENNGQIEAGVQFKSSVKTSASTIATNINATMPTGLVDKDVLVMAVGAGAFRDFTVDPSWTKFAEITDGINLLQGNMRFSLYWKRTNGTEPATTPIADSTSATRNWNVVISVWSGCISTGSPIDASAVFGQDSATTFTGNLTLPAVASTGTNRRFAAALYIRDLATAAYAELTWEAAFNENYEGQEVSAGVNSQTNGLADSFRADPETVAPVVTLTNAQKRYTACTFALIPEPMVAPPVTKTENIRPTSTGTITGLTPTASASATPIINDDPDAVNTTYLTGTDPSGAATTLAAAFPNAQAAPTGLTIFPWNTPANVIDTSDTTVATYAAITTPGHGSYFTFPSTAFSSVPANATITSIVVTARHRGLTSGRPILAFAQLGTANGTLLGTEQAFNAGADIGAVLTNHTLTFNTNLPTRDQLLASTFGVRYRAYRSGNTVTGELASIKATVTYSLPGTTTPIEVRVNMGNPANPLAKNTNLNGEMRALVRKKGTGSNPPINIELRELGVLKKTLITGVNVISTAGEVLSADIDHNLIANADNVEFWITSAGAPGGLVELGGIEWNAQTIPPVVNLNWNDNTEPDFSHYNIYRSTTSGGPYTKINTADIKASEYVDSSGDTGVTYYYVVTALDVYGNESGFSAQATPTVPVSGTTYQQALSVIIVATPTVARQGFFRRTLSAVSSGVASVAKRMDKPLSATATGVASVRKLMTKLLSTTGTGTSNFLRQARMTLSTSAAGTALLTAGKSFFRLLTATANGAATLVSTKSLRRALSASGTGTATVAKSLTMRLLAASSASVTYGKAVTFRMATQATGAVNMAMGRFYNRFLNATATGSSTVLKAVGKRISVNATGTPTMGQLLRWVRTLTANATGTAEVRKALTKTLQFFATGAASIAPLKAILKLMTATATGTVNIRKGISRTLSAAATGLSSITSRATYLRMLSAVATGSVELRKRMFRVLSASATGTAVLNRLGAVIVVLSATANGAASFSKLMWKPLSATVTATASLVRRASYLRTLVANATGSIDMRKAVRTALSVTATGIASLARLKVVLLALNAVATGTASFSKLMQKSLSATSAVTATLANRMSYVRLLVANATGTTAIRKHVSKLMNIAATGTASLARLKVVLLALNAVATGSASIRKSMNRVLSATSTATATLANRTAYVRTLIANATGLATMRKNVLKLMTMAATGTANLGRLRVVLLVLSAVATGAVSIRKGVNKTLQVAASVTPSIHKAIRLTWQIGTTGTTSVLKTVGKRMNITATGTAVINRLKVILKLLTATATGAVTIRKGMFKMLSTGATVTAVMVKSIPKTLAATGTGVVSVVKGLSKLLTSTATGAVSFSPRKAVGMLLSATANGTASVRKAVRIVLPVSATGTPSMVKSIRKLMATTASVVASLSTAGAIKVVLSAVATGSATMTRAGKFVRTLTANATGSISVAKAIAKLMNVEAAGTADFRRHITQTLTATATAIANLGEVFRPLITTFIHPVMNLARKQKIDHIVTVKNKIQAILRTFSQ